MGKAKERWIPAGYEPEVIDEVLGLAVYKKLVLGKVIGMAFCGKQSKPVWHYQFKDQAGLDRNVAELRASLELRAKWKAERKAEAEALKAQGHGVQVGDVFRCSWGYDQTNIQYYEVIELKGSSGAVIRELAQERDEDAFMQGSCVPLVGEYIGEPMVKRIQAAYKGGASIKIYDFASAYLVKPEVHGGCKVYPSSRWTAYA